MKTLRELLDITSLTSNQEQICIDAVLEFLEQFREPSIDYGQIEWNAGLDDIIGCVEKEKGGNE